MGRKRLNRQMALTAVLVCFLTIFIGCRGNDAGESTGPKEKIIVQIGDSILYESQVYSQIPSGITSQDSMMLFDAIVQNWLEKRLLIDVAELNMPDVERIERMVEDYRMQLITNEYRRVMAEANSDTAKEEEISRYYDMHRDELRLQWPLVKGIYVKVGVKTPHLDEIRHWISSSKKEDIRQLENYGLSKAMQYDNFSDNWVSWKAISELIPHRFDKIDTIPESSFLFEDTIGSSVYMLQITDVIPRGEVMPIEYARKDISRVLADEKRSNYDSDLLRKLFSQAKSSGKLKPEGYVPMKFRQTEAKKKSVKK